MKYKEIKIIESNILDGFSNHEVARRVGCNHSYISLLRSGKKVASKEFFRRLQVALIPTVGEIIDSGGK